VSPQPGNAHDSALLCLFLGLSLLVFGLTSYFIKGRVYLSTAVVALFCGIGLGPKGAGYVSVALRAHPDGYGYYHHHGKTLRNRTSRKRRFYG
jgi:hypothetical protein